ncbi:MAG: hypothetical protein ACM36C_17385 [Acidobacteriota bacterium]
MVSAVFVLVFALGQQQPVPQPFPRPGSSRPASPPATEPATQRPAPAPPEPATKPQSVAPQPPASAGGQEPAPTQATLGLPIYPAATFLGSFDAGQGQRYYLFGTNASFAEIVAYYRTYLKDRGELVFDQPPTHIFEVGRFREESMVYPPGITVKDYTWNGSEGYLQVKAGAPPQRYRTIIQIVPAPPGTPR